MKHVKFHIGKTASLAILSDDKQVFNPFPISERRHVSYRCVHLERRIMHKLAIRNALKFGMQCSERVISGYLWRRIVVDEAALIARHELADYCDTRIYIDKKNNPKYTSQWASSHKCGKPQLYGF